MKSDRFSSDAQMKKGVLEMCVLHLIREAPTYGYDVMKHIGACFPEVSESTVYAILRRLHGDGCAEITLSHDSGGPPRKYYHITQAGVTLLENSLDAWRRMNAALKQIGL